MTERGDEAVRKEFEAWARQLVADKAFNLTPCSNPSCGPKFHHYQFDSTNGAWASWQAAKSLYRSAAIQECADKIQEMKDNPPANLKEAPVAFVLRCCREILLALKER